jgi:hypothetical protein
LLFCDNLFIILIINRVTGRGKIPELIYWILNGDGFGALRGRTVSCGWNREKR